MPYPLSTHFYGYSIPVSIAVYHQRRGVVTETMAKLLKVPEAAEMLALSQKTVWQWIGERRIGVVRLGRAVRVPLTEIERLMEEGSTPAQRG